MSKEQNETLYKWSDQTINTQKSVEEQREQNALKFRNRGKMISEGAYTFLSDGEQIEAKRKKQSKFMKPVTDSLKALDELLTNEKVDIDNSEEISNAFLNVCQTCETYLRNRNPWTAEGKARKAMVQDFYNQVSFESMRFSERIKELKKTPEKAASYANWGELLADVRIEKYENGVDNVLITRGGAGTSDIYIVQKSDTKMFFKENEDMPSDDYREVLDREIEALNSQEERYQGKDKEEHQKTTERRHQILLLLKEFLVQSYGDNKEEAVDAFLGSRDAELLYYNEIRMLEHKRKINGKSQMQSFGGAFDEHKEFTAEDEKFLKNVLWNMYKAFNMQAIATSGAQIDAGAQMSKRNVAASRMAEMLGIGELIVPTKMTEISIDGKKMRGILMDDADAKDVIELEKEHPNLRYSPEAIKMLTTLQVFDLICGQVDRHDGNYLCRTKKDKPNVIEKIIGIDNDMAFGKLNYNDILKKGDRGCIRMRNIEKDGKLTVPAMDKEFALKILALEPAIIDYQMCDILSKEERKALIDRIVGVQMAISKRMLFEDKKKKANKKYKTKFLSTNMEWQNKQKDLREKVKKGGRAGEIKLRVTSYLWKDYL